MKCETCRDLLTAYLKEELEKEERERLEEHLASCAECAKEAEGARKVLALVEQASDPAVVSLVNGLIHEGIKARASDIHIQGIADHASVRYRVDGVLREVRDLDRNTQTAAVTRIKQMSGMNVAERRLPQDGRIHVLHEGKEYDLRVATVPAVLGETVVMRILDRGMLPVSLDQMGLRGETRQELEVLIHKPCGMLIVSGPTGSGKTTTLYALMQHLNDRKYHLMSVEDPVEFQIDGVTQIHINRKVGLDFVTAMRHCMRQDPDIIMCGEIRDRATAEMIVQAAITGHLVMSTLHTNDAICVIPRLLDIGLERFLVASSLIGAIAQRLVRKICPDCKEEYTASSAEVAWLHHAGVEEVPAKLWRGTGCEACKNTGHRGRVCAFEILTIDEQLQRMLAEGTDLREIKRTAAGKMRPMRYDAAQKVLAGETTAAEAMRVLAFTPEYR